jgi:hypothetical protein
MEEKYRCQPIPDDRERRLSGGRIGGYKINNEPQLMRLSYFYEVIGGRIRGLCESEGANCPLHGVSPLACLLTDDGGLGKDISMSWIEDGIAMVDDVVQAKRSETDWDREAWGAEIRADGVKIVSLHDDSCAITIPLASFRRALTSWRDFLAADDPRIGERHEIVL